MVFAESKRLTVLKSYIDRAISGKDADNRPQFQQMIKDSGKKMFEVILAWKPDRFTRSRFDSAHYKHILKKNAIRLVSATEHISEGSEGILLETLLEGMAEYYSIELAEKVVRGLAENALKYKYNGGTLPIGYTIDSEQHFQVDPVAAPVVLDVFTAYNGGATMQELVNILNEKGVRTFRGTKISLNIMSTLLKTRRYIGEYSYRDIVVPDGIPAIVPVDLFDCVQVRMKKNKKAPARHKAVDDYILTTKLHCGKRGAYMTGERGTSHTAKVHRYYKCFHTRKPRTCDKKSVKKDWIENLVIDQTMQVVMNDALLGQMASALIKLQGQESTTIPLLEKQQKETKKAIENMLNAIQAGIFTEPTKKRLDELEERRSQLETTILQEELQRPTLTKEQVLFWLHKFRTTDIADKAERQRLIDCFVNAIYLYDDKVALVFNYKDGTKTVTLSDVEGSDVSCNTAPR